MVNIKPLSRFVEEDLPLFVEDKENPDEWYVLIGSFCGEYSVHSDVGPDNSEEDLPPEMQDAQPNIDGMFQMGTSGWTADAFEDTTDLVTDYAGHGPSEKLDTRLLHILVVHEDRLSSEALTVANSDPDKEEAPADD